MIPTLLLALVACSPTQTSDGTAVGNLDATLRLSAPVSPDVVLQGATMLADRVDVLACDGEVVTLATAVGVSVDGSSTLALPTGTWCGARITTSTPASWTASSTTGFGIDLALQLGTLTLQAASPVTLAAGESVLWSLGNRPWLDAVRLGADAADVVVTPGQRIHDQIVAVITRDQALLRDRDDDGERDDDDDLLAGDDDHDDDDEPFEDDDTDDDDTDDDDT